MPGDTFKREVLELRREDVLSRAASLKDYAFREDTRMEDISLIRDEVKTLRAEIKFLKADIFKQHVNVKDDGGKVDISDLNSLDNDFREILRNCNIIESQTVVKSDSKTIDAICSIALEKFSLSVYDGDISKWSTWFSLFTNTIDPNLTQSQKFLYLKKYLTGEPLAICDQLEITDSNYVNAILLKNRYQNERRLGSYYLHQLINYNKKYSESDSSKFLTVHRSSITALKNLQEIGDLTDFCFFHITYHNLDPKLQQAFDMSRLQNFTVPKVEELLQFVQFAATNEELKVDLKGETKREGNKFRYKNPRSKNPTKPFVGMVGSRSKSSKCTPAKTCPCCSEFHKLYFCEKFKSESADRRNDLVRQWQRCFNCLGAQHDPCPSSYFCLVCKKPHHTLLHRDAAPSSGLVGCAFHQRRNQVLLGTISCQVRENFNKYIPIRVLLDTGAQTSVVTYELVKRLGTPLNFCSVSVRSLAAAKIPSKGVVNLTLRTSHESETTLKITAIALKRDLAGKLPATDVPSDIKNRFRHLKLADPNFTKSAKIDLILGADILPQVLLNTSIYKDEETGLIAQNTLFGFVIQGAIPECFHQKTSDAFMSHYD